MRECRSGLAIRSLLAAAVLGAGVAVPGASAQQANQLDGGTFEHRLADAYAGSETFAVRRRGEGIVAVGRVTREGGPDALRAIEVGLRVDPRVRPVRYELQTREGPPLHIVVNRAGPRLTVTSTSLEGEKFTEFLAHDDLLLLEREIAHHYGLLARRIIAASDPRSLRLEVLVPAEGRKVPVRVESRSDDTLVLNGRSLAVARYDLLVGDERTVLWVREDRGQLLRVAIPGRGWSAVRQRTD
jgi:hypothetical protein